jgi:gag-polypeptide of LTR copia-type/Zinc knuckle
MVGLTRIKAADVQIPKLTARNYNQWRELITPCLKGRGIWGYVDGDVKKPTDLSQQQIWTENDAIAVSIIKSSLSDAQLGHVMGIDDSKGVWDTLKRILQRDDTARLQSLIAEFIKFKLSGTSIDEGASKLTHLQNEIGAIDSTSRPSEAIKVQTLLASLGPEYETIRTAINASGISEFEDVVSRLRQAEDRIKEQNPPGVYQSEGNLARMTTVKKYGLKKVKCYYCGELGHFIKDCEEFRDEIKREISDEKEEHPGKGHAASAVTTARAWGVRQKQEPDTAW